MFQRFSSFLFCSTSYPGRPIFAHTRGPLSRRRPMWRLPKAEQNGSSGSSEEPMSKGVIDWVREGGGEDDDELGRLLDDPETNPLQLSEKIKQRQAQKRKEILGSDESGMQVRIRDVDTFDLWVWMELEAEASLEQQDMLEAVLTSWFMIGRLGGYNAMNLQVLYNTESRLSNMPYDQEQCESALQAFFHEMSDLEYQGKWARCWVNLGTADELALDILIKYPLLLQRRERQDQAAADRRGGGGLARPKAREAVPRRCPLRPRRLLKHEEQDY
eukprot:jgi/Botrbrau1/9807/Bobra.0322s0014.1